MEIGSVSNPGSTLWNPVWGAEISGCSIKDQNSKTEGNSEANKIVFELPALNDYLRQTGDLHIYPHVPFDKKSKKNLRTLANNVKPVFLSETGVGNLFDVINGLRKYELIDLTEMFDDKELLQKQTECFLADWKRFDMEDVYPFPEDIFTSGYSQQMRHMRHLLDLLRSNPQISGYGCLCISDEAMTGNGCCTFWRQPKTESMETFIEGWAPLKWCMFVEPIHGYAGRDFEFEVVLANEDVLKPGKYPVHVKVFGSSGTVWERKLDICIPEVAASEDGPLTKNVFQESIKMDVPPGIYEFAIHFEKGAVATGGRLKFYVSDDDYTDNECVVKLLGIKESVAEWLTARGVTCCQFGKNSEGTNEVILVGDLSNIDMGIEQWQKILEKITKGSTAIFLSPRVFKRGDESTGWLPLLNKGRYYHFNDWVFHKECVAKPHLIFEGLQDKGIMDWDYYGPLIPKYIFDGQDTPDEVVAAAFAMGYNAGNTEYEIGYASGVLFAGYRFGKGRFFINSFPILENLSIHPAADRMLMNILQYVKDDDGKVLSDLPEDFKSILAKIYS